MITYIKISLINMVVRLIVENHDMEESEAILSFYNSKIADKLSNSDTGLYLLSPYIIYELWNAEYQNGDFRQSPYYLALI